MGPDFKSRQALPKGTGATLMKAFLMSQPSVTEQVLQGTCRVSTQLASGAGCAGGSFGKSPTGHLEEVMAKCASMSRILP